MERELWKRLYRALRDAASGIHQVGVTYQPWHILAVFLWAVLHDRPTRRACDPRNWPSDLRPAARIVTALSLPVPERARQARVAR